MLVIDQNTQSKSAPSIFLHAPSGMGKTTFAIVGGTPLCILTEPKAMAVLRQINPQAIGLVPESLEDITKLFQLLGDTNKLAAKGIDRIVLDSFTDLTYSIPAWMGDPGQILHRMEIQQFGDLKSYALALVKAIQLTGYPSIIIARSTSKKIGRVEKIVPDGYGRSVEELPGKCLPTVESRYDADLGYIIDSSPDECSQRCGLPWVPQIFKGTANEFLAIVANGPATAVPPPPPSPAPKPKPAKTAREVIAETAIEVQQDKPKVDPVAENFVDAVCDRSELIDAQLAMFSLCREHQVSIDALGAYLNDKGQMTGGDWTTLDLERTQKLVAILRDPTRRHSFVTTALTKYTPAA